MVHIIDITVGIQDYFKGQRAAGDAIFFYIFPLHYEASVSRIVIIINIRAGDITLQIVPINRQHIVRLRFAWYRCIGIRGYR